MNDLLTILEEDADIDELVLEKYLTGTATELEKHTIERIMLTSTFNTEALEGLTAFNNKQQLSSYNQQLKKAVRALVEKKKKKRKLLDTEPWTIAAVAIILLLCIVCYLVIKLM
jgi:hypothetical protein